MRVTIMMTQLFYGNKGRVFSLWPKVNSGTSVFGWGYEKYTRSCEVSCKGPDRRYFSLYPCRAEAATIDRVWTGETCPHLMCDETEAHRSEETCSRPTSATRHQSQGLEAPAGCGSWESWSRWAWAGLEQVVLALWPLVIARLSATRPHSNPGP